MPAWLGPALFGLAGDVLGGMSSSAMSEKMAREQMDFQERMSSTAHTREVADLRRAGLNPILSANAGASSPSGAMGVAPNFSRVGTDTVSTALQAEMQKEQIENVKADTRLKDRTQPGVPFGQFGHDAGTGAIQGWKNLLSWIVPGFGAAKEAAADLRSRGRAKMMDLMFATMKRPQPTASAKGAARALVGWGSSGRGDAGHPIFSDSTRTRRP